MIAFAGTSHWAVTLRSGKEISERETKVDFLKGESRPVDWTRELVSTGDVKRISILWLHCPNGKVYQLAIGEKETAFQLKVGMAVPGQRGRIAQLIGRVEDKDTGACTCHIWDDLLGHHLEWKSTIRDMGSWSSYIAPIGDLSASVLGLEEAH